MEEPPEYDAAVELKLDLSPVSHQAPTTKKAVFREAMRHATKKFAFLFSGEVDVRIEWALSEQERYETSSSPDVDNVIKLILDGLSGPEGLLINDVQVQSVHCYWVSAYPGMPPVTIWVRPLDPERWVKKEGLTFVLVTEKLCFPMESSKPEVAAAKTALILKLVSGYDELLRATNDYFTARSLLPVQRFFHRDKVKQFRILTPAQIGVH